ncbi:MAG: ABC transporter ATP-binding protein [Flavobacteriaceae bacterium]
MPRRKTRPENVPLWRRLTSRETFTILKRLLSDHMVEHKYLYGVALFWMAIGAGATSAVALMTRSMVNSVLVAGDRGAVFWLSIGVMATFVVRGIALYFEQSTMANIQVSMRAGIERRQFASIIRTNFRSLEGKNPAQLANNALRNARAATSLINLVSTNIIKNALTLVGLAGVMFFQDPVLTIVTLLAAPFVLMRLSGLTDRIRNLSSQEHDLETGIAGGFAEAIHGNAVIKSFQLEDTLDEQMNRAIDAKRERGIQLRRLIALANPLMESLGGILIGLFILYAGWQTMHGGRTPGEFAAFLTAFLLAYQPARRLAGSNLEMQHLLMPVTRMYQEIDLDEVEDLTVDPNAPKVSNGSIAFRDVTFEYTKDNPGIRDVSFDIPSGTRVALVGRSGAGKSTTAKLLLGVLGEYEGTIAIGGEDIASMPLSRLRASIACVMQQTFLFEGTIRDNIACGRQGATDGDIEEAARLAGVSEFAQSLKEGLDTHIGSGGARLSGGQAQRIAIARALIKHSPILLFDEPTSALDPATEQEMSLHNIEGLKDKTVVTISHRLSTIRDYDLVIVLARGAVVGIGTHEALLAENAEYQKLFGERDGPVRRRRTREERQRRRAKRERLG